MHIKHIEQYRFLIFFSGSLLLMAQPFLPGYVIDKRIDNLITFEELRADVAALNEGNIYFPTISYANEASDNIFELRDKQYSYDYNKNFFGDVTTIGESLDRAMPYEQEPTMSDEDILLMIQEAKSDENLPKIERFITAYHKYLGDNSFQDECFSAKQVLADFQKEKVGMGDKLLKYQIEDRISSIENRKEKIAFRSQFWGGLGVIAPAFFYACCSSTDWEASRA